MRPDIVTLLGNGVFLGSLSSKYLERGHFRLEDGSRIDSGAGPYWIVASISFDDHVLDGI